MVVLDAMFLALALLVSLGPLVRTQEGAPEPPQARGWSDFPVFVWRETYAGKPLPPELAEPFGGVILMRGEDSDWARERGLSYLVWNVAGRDALHLDADEAWNERVEAWIRTHDEKLLVREPCLNDPETVQELFATLDATIAKHGAHPGLGFVLGDEVSLTPNGDPFDLCRCGFCEARWKEYAQAHDLPERAPLTDEVRLALLEDDFSLVGAWLARRRFDQDAVVNTVLRLRERVYGNPDPGEPEPGKGVRCSSNAFDPRANPLVGLLGLSGRTAFGGFSPSLAHLFDFVEVYPVVDARESFLASDHLARHGFPESGGPPIEPGATLATIFVDQEAPDATAWRIWEHWLRGGSGLVLWSDAGLERSPAHLERIADAVRDIRGLKARGIQPRLEQRGCAIALDQNSVAAGFLREALLDGPSWPRRRAGYQAEHGRRERKVRSWLRLIEDCGTLPVGIPLQRLQGDCAYTYGCLVLPEILVLSASDVRHLEEFLDSGGTLIVDGPLGWIEPSGRPWETSVLERLLEKAPGRVVEPPSGLETYLETRLDPKRSEVTRSFLRPLLARPSGSWSRPAIPVLANGAGPWLVNRNVAHSRGESGSLMVMLPNRVDASERAGLADIELRPQVPSEVGWIHPPDGKTLRAGDAAVLYSRRHPAPDGPR